MKKLSAKLTRVSTILIVFLLLSTISFAQTCVESNSASGNDSEPTVVTINSFPCASGTITNMTLDATIGGNCPTWYTYDIIVNGTNIEQNQCNQTGYDISAYLPITSVSLSSVDGDGWSDAITLELTLNITYAADPCSTPTDQPTSLVLSNVTHNSIDGSFTAAVSSPDNYIVVASTSSTLSANPVDGTTYSVGDPLGVDTVVHVSSSTSFVASGLSPETTYYFFVFSLNAACIGGPLYYTTSPLEGNETTTITPIVYCTSEATNIGDSKIDNVVLNGDINSINNNTASDCAQYTDFTGLTPPELSIGLSYQVDVTAGTCGSNYEKGGKIFIDWNNNGDFDDANEEIGTFGAETGTTTYNVPFTVPAGATVGNVRMRVIVREGSTPSNICSCGEYNYGETEDYTVTIATDPMSYVSSTTTQNTNSTFPGGTDQDVIGIQIVTSNAVSPFNVTEIDINMNGTTDISDVSNIYIYYTDTNSYFATTTLFGSIAPNTGTLTVTGSQILQSGTNYFWVVYNISDGAPLNNFVDAECEQISITDGSGIPVNPTVQAPDGEREILELVNCFHTIRLYDFDKTGWDDGSIDVIVDGVTIFDDLTLASGDNGIEYTFSAAEFLTIETVVNSGNTQMKYVILGNNGDFVLDDGNNQTIPTGQTGVSSCTFQHKFTLNGDAYYNGENLAKSNSSGDCITLTNDIMTQSSSAWYNYKIDLSNDFTIGFDLNFGDLDGTFGADGICFVLQDHCANVGGSGSSIGFGGIIPSVGIEFDTYNNGDKTDPGWDNHVSMFKNGSNDHASTDELVPPHASVNGTLTDGVYHPYSVEWTASTQTLKLYDNGSEILTYTGDIVADTDIFNGSNQVYWGFTSGTGGATNLHKLKMTQYPNINITTQLQDTTIVMPSTLQAEVQENALSYNWIPNDGSIDNTSAYNPTFTPTVTTTYCCDIEDHCSNITKDCFTITVNGVLPIELLSFTGNCNNGYADLAWETASEINNDYFLLQSSSDAGNWIDVAAITGAGNSNTMMEYNYTDYNNIDGVVYYRLKQVDYDGEFEYSETIVLNCDSKLSSVVFYPNPALDYLNISFKTVDACRLSVVIINSLGQQVLRDTYTIDKGESVITTDVSSLSEGVYLVKVIANDGNTVHTDRLIINKD